MWLIEMHAGSGAAAVVAGLQHDMVAPVTYVQLPVVAVIPPVGQSGSAQAGAAQVVVVHSQVELQQVVSGNCVVQLYPLSQYFAVLAMVNAQFPHVVIHPQHALPLAETQYQQEQGLQQQAHVAQLQALSAGSGQQWALYGGASTVSGEQDRVHVTIGNV